MGKYTEYLPTQGPAWLQGTNGQALSRALGTELDQHLWTLLQGLLARFPQKGNIDENGAYGLPPDDALAQIGADRMLRRGPGESSAAYAARLFAAWDIWAYAGTHYGVLRALEIAGYDQDEMIVVQQNGRYSRLTGTAGDITDLAFGDLMTCYPRGDLPGWTFDQYDDFYAQMGLVFTADAANLQDASGQAILLDIVNTWKPAKARFVGAFVILAGGLWGWPTGQEWGDLGDTWGGDSVRVIPGDGSAPTVTGP